MNCRRGIIKEKNQVINMQGNYKFTEFTAKYINEVRTKILGYTHEKFGVDIFASSQSTSYYLCTFSRRNHIHINVLRKIFLIEYNAHLFVQKQKKMSELLKKAIEDGIILEKTYPKTKPKNDKSEPDNKKTEQVTEPAQPPAPLKPQKTTLKYIYKTDNNLLVEFNKDRICIPISIFTLRKCVIDTSFVNRKGKTEGEVKKIADSIFDEENFSESLRYMSTDYDTLTYEEKSRADSYIANKIQVIFNKIIDSKYTQYPEELLYSEYWLYGMYLMHQTVTIPDGLQHYINKLYWNDENKTDWAGIFARLRTNENIKKLYQYENEDFVYFKDESRLISKHDFPLFVYKYIPIDFDKIDDAYCTDYVIANSPTNYSRCGQIKLIHLFMSIYAYFLKNGESETAAFEHTGQKMLAYGINNLPFNNPLLELYPLPQDPSIDIHSEATEKFHGTILELFESNTYDEKADVDIIEFFKNHKQNPHIFMKTIAFDFEIIKELNNALAKELRDELQSTVKKFKIKNKL